MSRQRDDHRRLLKVKKIVRQHATTKSPRSTEQTSIGYSPSHRPPRTSLHAHTITRPSSLIIFTAGPPKSDSTLTSSSDPDQRLSSASSRISDAMRQLVKQVVRDEQPLVLLSPSDSSAEGLLLLDTFARAAPSIWLSSSSMTGVPPGQPSVLYRLQLHWSTPPLVYGFVMLGQYEIRSLVPCEQITHNVAVAIK